jgi:signal transduction histidine kinase
MVAAGKDLEMVIKDYGKGIPEKNKNASGSGLLNIQRRIESMKSHLRYYNENGLTIVLSVPLE